MARQAFTFRFAEPDDTGALAALLREAELHYWGARDGAEDDARAVADAILGGRSGVQAVLACVDARPVGFATVTLLHPAPTPAGTLFMKDLYVSAEMRGSGIGRAFLRFLAGHAASLGCVRFDWTAEADNPRAVAFYEALGAEVVREKVYFRVRGEDLEGFGADEGPAS